MKGFRKTFTIIALAFAGMFLANMAVMNFFFSINVLHPEKAYNLESDSKANPFKLVKAFEPVSRAGDAYQDKISENSEDRGYDINTAPSGVSSGGTLPESTIPGDIRGDAGTGENTLSDDPAAYYMTTGEVGFLKNLSIAEKLEALSLISKIGKKEADSIYDMAMNGITNSEKKEIESILAKYLDPQELAALTRLLEKNREAYTGLTLLPR